MSPLPIPSVDFATRVRALLGVRDTSNQLTDSVISTLADIAMREIDGWCKALSGKTTESMEVQQIAVVAGSGGIDASDMDGVVGATWCTELDGYTNASVDPIPLVPCDNNAWHTLINSGVYAEKGTPQFYKVQSDYLWLWPLPDTDGYVVVSYPLRNGWGNSSTDHDIQNWLLWKTVVLCASRIGADLNFYLMQEQKAQANVISWLKPSLQEPMEIKDATPWY